jgi:integrase
MARTGTGRIFQRGETWWIDYSYRGKRHRESSESTKRSDATALLKKRMAEQGRGGQFIGSAEERVTFEGLASMIETNYQVKGNRSARALRFSLAHLREFFGMSRAIDITTDRINSYVAQRMEAGAAPATIQQELSHLKRAFNLAVQARRLSTRPHVPGIRVKNARTGFFEAADLERVVAELAPDVQPVIRFAHLTGWRIGEVLSLQWSQVDFRAGEVRLWVSKNDEPRVFPFHALPPLAALLTEQRERTRALERERGTIIPHLFHRGGQPIRSIGSGWRAACDRAGVPGMLVHDLRRTAVRNLELAGVSRSVAMKLTGHKTENVYRRYAITDSRSLADGVGRLAAHHAAPVEPSKVVPMRGALA